MITTGACQVGFEVDLLGTHVDPSHPLTAGCDECGRVFEALREIAESALAGIEPDTEYEMPRYYDGSLHASRKQRGREDVALTIELRHRVGFDRPVDAAEVRCLQQIEARLHALGARQGSWPAGSSGG